MNGPSATGPSRRSHRLGVGGLPPKGLNKRGTLRKAVRARPIRAPGRGARPRLRAPKPPVGRGPGPRAGAIRAGSTGSDRLSAHVLVAHERVVSSPTASSPTSRARAPLWRAPVAPSRARVEPRPGNGGRLRWHRAAVGVPPGQVGRDLIGRQGGLPRFDLEALLPPHRSDRLGRGWPAPSAS